jgi:7-cyano-7-deazaguanine synthase in queuosine biosynthesis
MKSILLFGGGKETVYNIHNSEDVKLLLYFNYGQKAYKKELKSLHYYSRKFKIPYRVINLKNIIHAPYSIRTGQPQGSSNVVMRNTIFTGIAVNIAKSIDCDNVIIGTVKAHASIKYTNDGFQHWLSDIKQIVWRTEGITLKSPSSTKTFEQICQYLIEQADISQLWLCEDNFKTPCGNCNKCNKFKEESHGKYSNQLYNKLYGQG